jgi:hypothetical protein
MDLEALAAGVGGEGSAAAAMASVDDP